MSSRIKAKLYKDKRGRVAPQLKQARRKIAEKIKEIEQRNVKDSGFVMHKSGENGTIKIMKEEIKVIDHYLIY